jgi:hypothetical protein
VTEALATTPKRTIADRRAEAYRALGISPDAIRTVPEITSQLRRSAIPLRAHNLPTSPYYYLRCSDADDAMKLMAAYYSLPSHQSRILPIEAFCVAAGVSPLRILDLYALSCRRVSATVSGILATISHPVVVKKNIERALDDNRDDSIQYMAMLHKAVGFLPTPKGSQTTVNVTANAQAANATLAAAPPPEQTIRRLVDLFNSGREPAQLPATSATEFPADDREPITVDASVVSDADEDELEAEE